MTLQKCKEQYFIEKGRQSQPDKRINNKIQANTRVRQNKI